MESGVTPDFFNKFKKLCKKVLTKESVCVIIIYVNKKRLKNLLVYKINSGKEMVICYFQN